jgi:hypothetical protein
MECVQQTFSPVYAANRIREERARERESGAHRLSHKHIKRLWVVGWGAVFLSLSLLFAKCHYTTWSERRRLILPSVYYAKQTRLRLRAWGIMICSRRREITLSWGGGWSELLRRWDGVRGVDHCYHKWVSSHTPCYNNMLGLVFIFLSFRLHLSVYISYVTPLRRLCYLRMRI